jgi:uncharacterized protein YunC (DUF1805 family)
VPQHNIDVERLAAQYRTMRRIRAFEDRAEQAQRDGLVKGAVHSSVGQEAIAVGVCSNLRRQDKIATNHRGHGHSLAKGVDARAMMLELFGKDMASRGRIGRVNQAARALGCSPGMTAAQCAERMRRAKPYRGETPSYAEARFCFRKEPGEPEVWGVDSASLVRPEDAGQIVITASHGALLAGETASAIKYDVLACAFNDAGFGADDIGASRLPALDQRGIAAVVLDCMTARIGDARSAWETGKVSRANATATKLGVKPGMTTQQFAEAAIRAKKK